MSLENLETVDAIGLEKASDVVVLTIVDSWDWDDERGHLVALQAKLNAYFGFIESNQIGESYPDAQGKILRIDLIGKYPLPTAAIHFLEKASVIASELGVTINSKLHENS